MLRRILVMLALLAVGAVAGACGGDDGESEGSGEEPRLEETTLGEPQAAGTWVRSFCEAGAATRRDLDALGTALAGEVGETGPAETKALLTDYFERAAERVARFDAELEELGPAPVEGGEAVLLALDDGIRELEDTFADAAELVQGLPESNERAFRREAGTLFDRLDERLGRLPQLFAVDTLDVPELDRAWTDEPSCRRFEGN